MKLKKKKESSIIRGKIWILGDNVNTDDIVPSHVLTCQNKSTLVSATLKEKIPNFSNVVSAGDWIIAGKNFGCGSSREEAVFVLKELMIGGIIAQSFARIFFRNAINLGLPVITIANSYDIGNQGEEISVDIEASTVKNLNSSFTATFSPFPPFLLRIFQAGGLISYLQTSKS